MSYLRRDLLIFFGFVSVYLPLCCYLVCTSFEGTRLILSLLGIALSIPLVLPGVIFHAIVADDAQGIEGYEALHHPEHLTGRGRWYRRAYFIWVGVISCVLIFGPCLGTVLLACFDENLER